MILISHFSFHIPLSPLLLAQLLLRHVHPNYACVEVQQVIQQREIKQWEAKTFNAKCAVKNTESSVTHSSFYIRKIECIHF